METILKRIGGWLFAKGIVLFGREGGGFEVRRELSIGRQIGSYLLFVVFLRNDFVFVQILELTVCRAERYNYHESKVNPRSRNRKSCNERSEILNASPEDSI